MNSIEHDTEFFNLYRDIPVMMHSIDQEGRIEYVSDLWLSTLGYEECEVLGRRSTDFLSEKSKEKAVDVLNFFFKHGFCRDIEYEFIKKNGQVVDVLLTATSVKDKTNKIIRSVAVSVDISERKRLEKEVELKKMALYNSANLAELGKVSGYIAHEINNPLSIISGRAQRIIKFLNQEDLGSHRIADEANGILETVTRISKIVGGLQTISRPQVDYLQVSSISKMIEMAVDSCSGLLKRSKVEVEIIDFQEGNVNCNPSLIAQVFVNLINNSVDELRKAERERKIKIESKVGDLKSGDPRGGDKRVVKIVYRDSGEGVAEELEDSIFTPYFTTKDYSRGTGLGLSLAREIIESHGGKITYNGKKKQFEIVLPRVLEALDRPTAN